MHRKVLSFIVSVAIVLMGVNTWIPENANAIEPTPYTTVYPAEDFRARFCVGDVVTPNNASIYAYPNNTCTGNFDFFDEGEVAIIAEYYANCVEITLMNNETRFIPYNDRLKLVVRNAPPVGSKGTLKFVGYDWYIREMPNLESEPIGFMEFGQVENFTVPEEVTSGWFKLDKGGYVNVRDYRNFEFILDATTETTTTTAETTTTETTTTTAETTTTEATTTTAETTTTEATTTTAARTILPGDFMVVQESIKLYEDKGLSSPIYELKAMDAFKVLSADNNVLEIGVMGFDTSLYISVSEKFRLGYREKQSVTTIETTTTATEISTTTTTTATTTTATTTTTTSAPSVFKEGDVVKFKGDEWAVRVSPNLLSDNSNVCRSLNASAPYFCVEEVLADHWYRISPDHKVNYPDYHEYVRIVPDVADNFKDITWTVRGNAVFEGELWNLRSGESIFSQSIGSIENGFSIELKEINKNWVYSESLKGYLFLDPEFWSSSAYSLEYAEGDEVVVDSTTPWRVRFTPEFRDNVLYEIPKGKSFKILEVKSSRWYKVVDTTGREGFLNIPYGEEKWFKKK